MSAPLLTKRTFFNIQRLAEHREFAFEPQNGVIEIYLVYNGKVSFEKNGKRTAIESNTLYWACQDDPGKKKVSADTEGYLIRFNKSLLRYCRQDKYGAIFSSSCPMPYQSEIVQPDDHFIDASRWLCETMRQENRQNESSKTQMLAGLLGVFVALLLRGAEQLTPLAVGQAGI